MSLIKSALVLPECSKRILFARKDAGVPYSRVILEKNMVGSQQLVLRLRALKAAPVKIGR